MFRLRQVGLFGIRYALNMVIDWVNYHEKQSQETLKFRKDAEQRLATLEERITDLEDRASDVPSVGDV